MDRTAACGAADAGSIPAGSTKNPTIVGSYFDIFLIAEESLDFFLEAAFFFMSPLFVALSRTLYALGRSSLALLESLEAILLSSSLTVSFRSRFLRRLITLFRRDALCVFFAPFVTGIKGGYIILP